MEYFYAGGFFSFFSGLGMEARALGMLGPTPLGGVTQLFTTHPVSCPDSMIPIA